MEITEEHARNAAAIEALGGQGYLAAVERINAEFGGGCSSLRGVRLTPGGHLVVEIADPGDPWTPVEARELAYELLVLADLAEEGRTDA